MKKEIAEIKAEIKKLGDVNVNAIEDYKNLMERYTFLKAQHDDLVEAEKTLGMPVQTSGHPPFPSISPGSTIPTKAQQRRKPW